MAEDGKRPAGVGPPGRRTGWGCEWLGYLLAVLAVLVTLGLQVSGRFEHPPAWLPIVLYSVAAVLALATMAVKWYLEKLQRIREWERQVRALLVLHPGRDGQLPRLSILGPYKLGPRHLGTAMTSIEEKTARPPLPRF